jgi:citrate/tricarballylate utilization protein
VLRGLRRVEGGIEWVFLTILGALPAGAFYRYISHGAVAGFFGVTFFLALSALALEGAKFWRFASTSAPRIADGSTLWQAVKDAGSLRYLDGGKQAGT